MRWARWPALPPVRVPLRLRVLLRGVFAALLLALLALALSVLRDEKQRSHRVYADGLAKSQAQIVARLRHPTGQLALLNPGAADRPAQPLAPLVLPYRALDFSDRQKAQQAVEMAGCALQYPDGATLCAAVGHSPYGGAFVYLVASLAAGELVAHAPGDLAMAGVHRAVVDLAWRDSRWRWTAPYELDARGNGRLTGYVGDAPVAWGMKPVRDFEGWLWQEGRCLDAAATLPGCARRSFVSLRLPVEVLRDALKAPQPVWPPPDLARMALRLRLLGPGSEAVLFDSDAPGATLPFSMQALRGLLLPGEKLSVQRAGAAQPLFTLTGAAPADEPIAPWIAQLIRRLPVDGFDAPLAVHEPVDTALGRYQVTLAGDLRSVNQALAAVATRLAWTVGAMLLAVGLAWAVMELFVVRRITLLTKGAAAVSLGVRGGTADLAALDLPALRGGDELGVLARGLRDLLQRVHEDTRREQIRAQQEKDMWHAVGHEIVSPLQSLLALHGRPGDPAARYLQRMQQAVKLLYGQASPREAFAASTLAMGTLDLDHFLAQAAANVDMADLHYTPRGAPLAVQADEHALEDVVGHVLANAQRHRTPGTPVTLGLAAQGGMAVVTVHNQGPGIAADLLERIFDYGVSGAAAESGQRGQGLFVARTYMAKMGGTIAAENVADGVVFRLSLPVAVGG
jgi:signal transduction histidine kinase